MKRLDRRLGLLSVTAISLGAMLGSGLFVLPGVAASITGPSMWLAYLLAGVCVLPAALTKSELATAMPTSGGSYVYIERTFGPLAGTIGGLGLWASLLLKSSFALIGMTWYLKEVLVVPERPTALAVLGAVTLLNVFGVRKVGKAQIVMVAASVIGLVALSIHAAVRFDPALLDRPWFTGGAGGLATAVAVVYISYAGVTKIAAVAEEVRDPGRTLPLAMMISLAAAALLYSTVTFILVDHVPADLPAAEGGLRGDYHPIYTLALRLTGHNIALGIAVLGVLTMASMANAGVLAASRFPFAMSRDGLVPSKLGAISTKFITPVASILVTATVMALAIVFLDVIKLAKLASAFMIMIFIAIYCALIVLRESSAPWYRPHYRAPLYPWMQIFGVLSGCVLLALMDMLALLAIVAIVVPSGLLFLSFGRHQRNRSGALQRFGQRKELLNPARAPSSSHQIVPAGPIEVVVALLDRSPPEPLVELGLALAGGRPICTFQVQEVPEQLGLEALEHESALDAAVERRARGIASNSNVSMLYDKIVCRDVRQEVFDIASITQPGWLLFHWQTQGTGAFLVRNPLSWLFSHLPCNVAVFKDAGVRVFEHIVVVVDDGDHDRAMAHVADLLATASGGEVTFLAYVPPKATDAVQRAVVDYQRALVDMVEAPARSVICRGPKRVPAMVEATAGYDLLLVEEPVFKPFRSHFVHSDDDLLTAKAACSVLRMRIPREAAGSRIATSRRPDKNDGRKQTA